MENDQRWYRKVPWYVWHLLGFTAAYAVLRFVWRCPIRLLFGISCPGCGLTRAVESCLQLHPIQAFSFHPLYPVALLLILYVAHQRILPKRFSPRTEKILAILFIALFTGVYLYRMVYGTGDIVTADIKDGLLYRFYIKFKGGF